MLSDGAPPAGERPALHDVSEEEGAFGGEERVPGPLRSGSWRAGPGEEVEKEGSLCASQMEADIVQVTFRKQVSYSF